jgi:hypothetical protein
MTIRKLVPTPHRSVGWGGERMLSGTQWSQRSVRSGEFLAQHTLPYPFGPYGLTAVFC